MEKENTYTVELIDPPALEAAELALLREKLERLDVAPSVAALSRTLGQAEVEA